MDAGGSAGGGGAGRGRAGDDDATLGTTFAVLLAAALLLHVLWWHGFPVASPWTAVAAAAAWLIGRPYSVGRLALLLAAAAGTIVAELPGLGSHLLLVLAIAVCVLVDVVGRLLRTRRLQAPGELWARLAPFLRAAVVVLYVAAVLSKLNDVYLDPGTTPAGPLAGKVVWFAPLSFAGDWRASVAIWGSILVEAALPVLLLTPRTRRAGLVLGLFFHGLLAASGTVPFTALMLALYVAFLPAGATRAGLRVPGPTLRRGAALGVLVVLWFAGALADLAPGRVDGSVLATLTRLAVLGAVLAAVGRLLVRGRRTPHRRADSGRPRGVFLTGAVVLVTCAASPYLGGRAGDAFTMYSGLRTGPSSWNHVVVPSAVRLRDRR